MVTSKCGNIWRNPANRIFPFLIGYAISFFKGTIPPSEQEVFNIPSLWSFYFIYFFAITGYESSQIFSKFEQQKLIRQGKRKHWWYLKFFQILKETAIYLVITYVTMGIYGICTDAKIGGLSRELQFQYNGLSCKRFLRYNCLSI